MMKKMTIQHNKYNLPRTHSTHPTAVENRTPAEASGLSLRPITMPPGGIGANRDACATDHRASSDHHF